MGVLDGKPWCVRSVELTRNVVYKISKYIYKYKIILKR